VRQATAAANETRTHISHIVAQVRHRVANAPHVTRAIVKQPYVSVHALVSDCGGSPAASGVLAAALAGHGASQGRLVGSLHSYVRIQERSNYEYTVFTVTGELCVTR
jgi:hypothetical protein